ncbi:MAG TPA: hypothetical protein VH206_14285 [Xanthobacteraceae bacterium]|nr:hypothetical protein [Xanthobacteraceae bacterium]
MARGIKTRLQKAEAQAPQPTVEFWVHRPIIKADGTPFLNPDGSPMILKRKSDFGMSKKVAERRAKDRARAAEKGSGE